MNDEMDDLLKNALQRQPAPPGFASRVAARLPAGRQAPRRPWMAIGLAASLLIGVGGVRMHEYRKGQEAKRQLMLALEITAEKLELALNKVERSHVGGIER